MPSSLFLEVGLQRSGLAITDIEAFISVLPSFLPCWEREREKDCGKWNGVLFSARGVVAPLIFSLSLLVYRSRYEDRRGEVILLVGYF